MKTTFKKIISLSADVFPLRTLIPLSGQTLIMPFYHLVSDTSSAHTKHLYPTISTKRFKQDLDFLQKNYTSTDANYLKSKDSSTSKKNERYFFLSFDDGLREFHDVVAPILCERGIKATCFVNTDFIDNKAMFYRLKTSILIEEMRYKPCTKAQNKLVKELMSSVELPFDQPEDLLLISDKSKHIVDKIAINMEVDFNEYLSVHKPYLSTTEIERLIKKGFSIGSHSMSHPYYPFLNEEAQLTETLNSIRILQEKFKTETRLFSFPYTDFEISKSFFDHIKNEIDFSFGTANLKLDEIHTNFQRIPMEIVGSKSAASIIKSEYLLFIIKKLFSKHIIHRT